MTWTSRPTARSGSPAASAEKRRGAGPRDRRDRDDRGRPFAARAVPEPEGPDRRRRCPAADGRSVRPRRRLAAGTPADSDAVPARPDELGGRVLRLGLFAVYGAVQVAVTFAVCLPLERWRPVERWPDSDAVLVDVLYTVLSRVGMLPLVTYVLFYRAQVAVSRLDGRPGLGAADAGGLFPVPAGPAGADVLPVCGDPGFRRLLAALAVASVPLVVGAAFAAPRAAADDVLVG